MQYQRLILEKEGHIATVTFNRPDQGNSFDFVIMEEIDHVLRALDEDNEVRAVIVTGAGKYFCTGVDLTMFVGGKSEPQVDKQEFENGAASSRIQEELGEVPWGKGTVVGAVVVMRTMRKPVIAAVNGPAVGLGFSMALACDIRVGSDTARFSTIFVKRGLAPDTGASFTLPRVIGFPKAIELFLTGDTIDAAEALRLGIVSKVVPQSDVVKAAREIAAKIAKHPPLAVSATKQALYASAAETDIIEQMKREIDYQDKMLNTEDFQEAARAFLEKRDPVFKGR
ncbi:MAG: enoyl-CoA hydratase [Dehalococcoidia bacterium]|nr:enoyl-CoA hydratase [Dehalococcoidia bacterium]